MMTCVYRPLSMDTFATHPAHWSSRAVFYHIYPLGLCNAPPHNDSHSLPGDRLEQLYGWLDHFRLLGINALYLGPLFESSTHGYDTLDYGQVDRRLGTNAELAKLVRALHAKGIRVVLDAVFNHVGRGFWAFRDVQKQGRESRYCNWFHGLDFSRRSPHGDAFAYEGWKGHFDLVKLNLASPEVRQYLLNIVKTWIQDFAIDGLRLDAADCMDVAFMQELAGFCRGLKPDFWLKGEMVHGDYAKLANHSSLDSVTNYEAYHALHTSHNQEDYQILAHTLERQFGSQGVYRHMNLYTFADNHDVDRAATILKKPRHLSLMYTLLFTLPGVPSIYYGSEWGIAGKKHRFHDRDLRPHLRLDQLCRTSPYPQLMGLLPRLSKLRRFSPAMLSGSYQALDAGKSHLVFTRNSREEQLLVAVNNSEQLTRLSLPLASPQRHYPDLLNPGERVYTEDSHLKLTLAPYGARILQLG